MWLYLCMSGEIRSSNQTKVNVNTLMKKIEVERKKDRKNNLYLSAAAVSAVVVFGAILTL